MDSNVRLPLDCGSLARLPAALVARRPWRAHDTSAMDRDYVPMFNSQRKKLADVLQPPKRGPRAALLELLLPPVM